MMTDFLVLYAGLQVVAIFFYLFDSFLVGLKYGWDFIKSEALGVFIEIEAGVHAAFMLGVMAIMVIYAGGAQ